MTLSIGLRNMRTGKVRLAFSVGGVAVAVLLLQFILGLYRGWNDELGRYIDDTDADVWVSARGSESFFTPGFYNMTFARKIGEVPGVEQATIVRYRPVKLIARGEGFDTWLVGFIEGQPGGPTKLIKGSGAPGPGEVILDKVLSELAGVGVGDTVEVAGEPLKVVGISSGGNVVFAQIGFVSADQMQGMVQAAIDAAKLPEELAASASPKNNVNLTLVRAKPGVEPEALAAEINATVPAINAFVSSEFADGSRAALRQSIVPILVIILILAFLVGTLVLALTVYTSILEKEREFGVIKALGTPGFGLMRVVAEQALVACLAGFVVGEIATVIAAQVTTAAVPQFVIALYPSDAALVFVGALGMSVFASFVPAQRIRRVDALSVFKA